MPWMPIPIRQNYADPTGSGSTTLEYYIQRAALQFKYSKTIVPGVPTCSSKHFQFSLGIPSSFRQSRLLLLYAVLIYKNENYISADCSFPVTNGIDADIRLLLPSHSRFDTNLQTSVYKTNDFSIIVILFTSLEVTFLRCVGQERFNNELP